MVSVAGTIDTHVHANPSLFDRIGDDADIVAVCRAAGMAGMVLKSHHENTASRAHLMQRQFPDISVMGGVVLNRFVGGINPHAVAACLSTGGRIVWMPTIHAAAHRSTFKTVTPTIESHSHSPLPPDPGEGIDILAGKGLTDEVYEVLDLVRSHDAVLATGHLNPPEIMLLLQAARECGVERLVVNHPHLRVPGMTLEEIKACADLGAYIEMTYCTISPMWAHATLADYKAAIDAVGTTRCILSSDAGQKHNPWPPEALRLLLQGLVEQGIPEQDLRRMTVDNPAHLLTD